MGNTSSKTKPGHSHGRGTIIKKSLRLLLVEVLILFTSSIVAFLWICGAGLSVGDESWHQIEYFD